jgi:hypothetical protein
MSQTHKVLVVVAGPEEDPLRDGPDQQWLAAIPASPTAEWPWVVRAVSYSVGSASADQVAGIIQPPLQESGRIEADPIRTWDVLPAVADASVVHVCRPFTRAGEVAVLAGRTLGKPVAVSDLLPATSTLGRSFELLSLAHVIICRCAVEVDTYSTHPGVEVIDFTDRAWVSHLSGVYEELLGRSGRQA